MLISDQFILGNDKFHEKNGSTMLVFGAGLCFLMYVYAEEMLSFI